MTHPLTEAERLNLALDATQMGVWDWDIATDEIYWNPYHELLLGYEPGQPRRTYQEWVDRIHPEDLPRIEASLQAAMQQGEDYIDQYRVVLPDGSIRWIETFGRFYHTPDGQPIRMIGMVLDATRRKSAEQALQANEQREAALAKILPVGVFRTDAAGRCTYVNQRWCEITGLTLEEALGDGWVQSIIPTDRQQLLQAWEEVVRFKQPFKAEYCCQRPDGVVTWALWQAIADDTEGNPGFVGTITDITERKQAEVELAKRASELLQLNQLLAKTTTLMEKQNQELDQFAYVASHDLKAPLRAIANLSEWLEEDLMDRLPDENRHQLQLLRNRVHRMEALIDGLLQYSRIGRTQSSVERVDVKTLLHEVIDLLTPPAEFTVSIATEMPVLQTKPLLLRQVFANLIGNAIKHHNRSDGIVQIQGRSHPEGYEFSITDDGPGIAPEYHEKIFVIFQTLEARDTKESTGIGLSIVKKIIEAEGGKIWLDSQVGVGTTFYFTWPQRESRLTST